MNNKSASILIFSIFSLVVMLSGCGEVKPPPTHINVEIKAVSALNPDESGRPSPIVVRIYALRSLGKFNSADFYSLYNEDQAQLGGDMISMEEFHLTPGGQRVYARDISQDALYLGVMAAYRSLDNAVWRDSIPVPGGRTTNFAVKLGTDTVSIRAQ